MSENDEDSTAVSVTVGCKIVGAALESMGSATDVVIAACSLLDFGRGGGAVDACIVSVD